MAERLPEHVVFKCVITGRRRLRELQVKNKIYGGETIRGTLSSGKFNVAVLSTSLKKKKSGSNYHIRMRRFNFCGLTDRGNNGFKRDIDWRRSAGLRGYRYSRKMRETERAVIIRASAVRVCLEN